MENIISTNEIKSRIIYMQKDCLVINKVAGESVQADLAKVGTNGRLRQKGEIDLHSILEKELGEKFTAVHRLDVPVSGLVLFVKAQAKSSLAFLNQAFAEKRVEKKYWAIVEKTSEALALPQEGFLKHWIKSDHKLNKSTAYSEKTDSSKESSLFYRIIGTGTHYLFIEIELFSGRHHQIRAQLAHLGLHIKGDLKYGARRSEKTGGIRLHSHYLSFPKPNNPGEKLCFSALPTFFDRLWSDFAEKAKLSEDFNSKL